MDAVVQSPDNFPEPSDERRFPRRPVLFARVEFGDDPASAGIVVNVSEGGLCVQTAKQIPGDWPLRLRVHCLPAGWVEATGRPIWQDQARLVTGIQFVDLSDKARREINKWLTFGTSLEELRGNWSMEGSRRSRQTSIGPGTTDFAAPDIGVPVPQIAATAGTEEARFAPRLDRGHIALSERSKHSDRYWRSVRAVLWGIVVLLAFAVVWTARRGELARRIELTLTKHFKPPQIISSLPSKSPAINKPAAAVPPLEKPPAENTLQPKSASAPLPPNANASGGTVLQVAAMNSVENANALAESLRQKNFPAFESWRPGDRFYRVLVGPYLDQASLASAKEALKKEGVEAVAKRWTSGKPQARK